MSAKQTSAWISGFYIQAVVWCFDQSKTHLFTFKNFRQSQVSHFRVPVLNIFVCIPCDAAPQKRNLVCYT